MANRTLIPVFLLLITLGLPTLALAEGDEAKEPKVTFHPRVQERARFELMPGPFSGDPVGGWQVGNRARLGLEARFGKAVSAYVEVQDVRTWGSEYKADTLSEGTFFDWVADGLDMHQAYGQVDFGGAHLRVGRQEIAWHGQRLIGTVGWAHQGRSFDAVRFFAERETVGYELFYAVLLNRPVGGDPDSTVGDDSHLVAFRAGPRLGDALALDGLFIGNMDQGTNSFLGTFGVHAKGKVSAFAWEAEGYGQVGRIPGDTYGAYMFGIRAGGNLGGGHYVGGGFDLVSGTNDDGSVRTFDTLFATNHKFYGHFDAYLAMPKNAPNGLINPQLNTRFALHERVKLKVDVHVFASADNPEGAEAVGGAFHGVEIDTNVGIQPIEPLTLAAGVWVYVPGAHWGEDLTPSLGAYFSTDFQFK